MTDAYRILKPNRYLSAQIRLIREWSTHDVVIYSQLVDLTAVERERERRRANGLIKPSYTAFVIDSIARALRDHPKLNRMIYRGLTGYRYTQFKHVDVVIAVEVVQDDLDIAYGSILRDVDRLGLDGIAEALQGLAQAPANDPQLRRLGRLPAMLMTVLARCTGLHPMLWTRFRGASCAVTSPAKYGIESIVVKGAWPVQFAFGRVEDRPMVVNGQCLPRRSVVLTMAKHRELAPGAVAAPFFEQVVQQLQRGEESSRHPERQAAYG